MRAAAEVYAEIQDCEAQERAHGWALVVLREETMRQGFPDEFADAVHLHVTAKHQAHLHRLELYREIVDVTSHTEEAS